VSLVPEQVAPSVSLRVGPGRTGRRCTAWP